MSDYRPEYFDPLSTERLTTTICGAFEHQPLVPLTDEIPKFPGAGLYALYYRGNSLPLYAALSDHEIPVYVGQAASSNSATGKTVTVRDPLHERLSHHRVSVRDAALPLTEFAFRALRMPDVHANLGEDGLRRGYQPVWNAVLTGFGSKEQGSATRKSAKSKWDTVHEGRKRTFGTEKHDRGALEAQVREHIAAQLAAYDDLPWRRVS